nr:serine--tRNA synthetase-like protein Slimp [Onthophagus taurus]XP_022907943.1 serine--tRNA synthetase-like protein Slimp [Onthophagus taurus]
MLRKIFKRIVNLNNIQLRFKSALYVTGDKAGNTYSLLTPHIDFEDRIKDINELKFNLKARKKAIDLDKIIKNWSFYRTLIEDLAIMDVTKQALSRDIAQLLNNKEKESEINHLKDQARLLKGNYNTLKNYLYPVEETAALNALSIPNVLDKRTPIEKETLIHSLHQRPTIKSKSHLNIGEEKKMLRYINPSFFFLENEGADFEFALSNYTEEIFTNNNFIPVVSPSFVRSAIVEGCCSDFSDANKIFTIHEDESKFSVNRLHLTGGASLEAFMAYFTRFSIQTSYLPIKLFTNGKIYEPVSPDFESKEPGLFHLNQYTTTRFFVATTNNEEAYKNSYDEIVDIIKKFYDPLGFHYTMTYVPAGKLEDYETLRLSVQMYSANLERYIEIGFVSLCEEYLSKRLLVTYKDDNAVKYCRILTGCLVNTQKLFGCILEYNDVEAKDFSVNLTSKNVQAKKLVK